MTDDQGARRGGASSVARWRCLVAMNQKTDARRHVHDTARNPNVMSPVKPLIRPMSGGEMASPRAWMTRMFRANALARTDGCVTLARIVLVGPVLKNRQKHARKMNTQASGNGAHSDAR